MRIKNLSYKDNASSWELRQIGLDQLNLLVGASGVGKTMSLNVIYFLSGIARGNSVNGVEWSIAFIDEIGRECIWEGKFENLGLGKEISKLFKTVNKDDKFPLDIAKIVSEKLIINNYQVITRTAHEILFFDKPTIKLSPTESAINLLKEETQIQPVYQSFLKIFRNETLSGGRVIEFNKIASRFTTLTAIQNSNLDTFLKLALLSQHEPIVFEQIKTTFIAIFPHIENIQIKTIEQADLPLHVAQFPFVQIKEKYIDRWIFPWELSSGMLKTLGIISDLYLLPAGSVLLIDELENSLGINCIDDIGELLSTNSNIQLIVTSHHPYIINTIDMQYWRILTRQGSVVTGRKAQEFERLAKKSMHDNYTRLLEIEEIIQGVQA